MKFRKVLALSLASMMTLSLAACGGSSDSGSTESTDTP
ncbi:MAG: ABC transporter substrate-binding protein, partial [Clostridia bacterium]|nr:ABC transporter substrate-binding protein [Clostridia bacterium]